DAAVGEQDFTEHARDRLAVRDVTSEADGRAAVAYACARDADAGAVLRDDLGGGLLGRRFVQINADDVRALAHDAVRRGLADAGARADDDDHLAVEFLFGRQAAELGLFERPVLDVESLLLIHRLVLVNGLGPAHHLDGAVVELGGHARLALVLAPGDHP